MSNFTHLHVHSEFSLLDGAARIGKLVKTCKDYDMHAIAVTDHGNMFSAITFYDECMNLKKKTGYDLKPIIGCEFYIVEDLAVKVGRHKNAHLILLAKNEQGYLNLSMLNTIGFRDGMYSGKARIDYKTLAKYAEGCVCLSACLAGDIPQLILQGDIEGAEKLTLWFKSVFHDDFYLELQNHGIPEQLQVNEVLRKFSKKFDIKLVATNDVHYIYKEDAEMQDVLMCVQMQKTLDDPDRLKFDTDEFYLKTYDEMLKALPQDREALDTTNEIADKCNVTFEYGKYLYPHFVNGGGKDSLEFLKDLIEKGIIKRYGKETPEVRERIDSEMELIVGQKYVDYYLVVWDYINAAKNMGISVGPGRGSGAGSLVAFLIGITNIDPLKFDLLFERFLHKERVSAPDFDVDFSADRRGEVVDYVRKTYTDDKVVNIVTFGTMAAKAAIKDVARVLRVSYQEVDKITKSMPKSITRPNIIKKCFGLHIPKEGDKDFGKVYGEPDLIEMYKNNPSIKRVIDIAIKLEDSPRNTSMHPCGVVIGGVKLDEWLPLARNGECMTTQYDMNQIEHLGHLKMDFLGLRNLDDIALAIKYIKENYNKDIDFDNCNYDDPEVFKLISTGNTKAIFQIESGGFQRFMRDLKPTSIEDITAGVSLYRPGPMDSIPRYVHNKHNPQDVKYDDVILEKTLKNTYGCIVYQEQVMRICQDMAGYTLGQADMVRRMMGKKKIEEMRKEKQTFLHGKPSENGKPAIDGAIKRGVSEEIATKVWGEMETFAQYAFNKSHAAAYSLITYQTAFLKCYYEAEFLTAVLNNRITKSDELQNYVAYARSEGIEVLPPDINESKTMFSVKNNKIRFGLNALKGVGENVCLEIEKERTENGDFKNLMDFLTRTAEFGINKRVMESLIFSGAFDKFGKYRSQLAGVYETAMDRAIKDKKARLSGQFSLFDTVLADDSCMELTYPNVQEYEHTEKLKREKEVVGIYLSGHPLSKYKEKFKAYNFSSEMFKVFDEDDDIIAEDTEDEYSNKISKVDESGLEDGMSVTWGGIIAEVKKITAKASGKPMAILTVEDLYGTADVMIFTKNYEPIKNKLENDKLITIKGRVSIREGSNPIIIAEKIEFWEDNNVENQSPKRVVFNNEEQNVSISKLFLKFNLEDEKTTSMVREILTAYNGNIPVFVQSNGKLYNFNTNIEFSEALRSELACVISDSSIKLKE